MERGKENPKDHTATKEPNMIPPTEIARNPDPRANENILKDKMPDGQMPDSGVGSEITDGEDA